jgi:hypothetical protein
MLAFRSGYTSQKCIPAYLYTCIPAYLYISISVYLYTSKLASAAVAAPSVPMATCRRSDQLTPRSQWASVGPSRDSHGASRESHWCAFGLPGHRCDKG